MIAITTNNSMRVKPLRICDTSQHGFVCTCI
jgi:hypothetical protein